MVIESVAMVTLHIEENTLTCLETTEKLCNSILEEQRTKNKTKQNKNEKSYGSNKL